MHTSARLVGASSYFVKSNDFKDFTLIYRYTCMLYSYAKSSIPPALAKIFLMCSPLKHTPQENLGKLSKMKTNRGGKGQTGFISVKIIIPKNLF